jgi:photosystem II stability/assembly factor-like uncharacterized protein
VKTRLISLLLIGILLLGGCVQENEVGDGFVGPDGYKTPEEYGEYCRKNPVECEIWCEKNPELCPRGQEPYIEDIDLSVSWEPMNGPPGGRVKELVQNPSSPYELYAVTSRGIHKSEDKGESWQLIVSSQDLEQINSIAVFRDRLFVCGEGVYHHDKDKNLVLISKIWCTKSTVSDNKLFVASGGERIKDLKLTYSNVTSDSFNWKDITPSQSELSDLKLPPEDVGFAYSVKTQDVVSVGDGILANIIVKVDGSGEFTNGGLYISEDFGDSWYKVNLGLPEGVIISKIIQDPKDPNHIILSCKHTITHEVTSPISELLKGSYDGGRTWSSVTDLSLESNGIEDVVISGNAYYLLNPYGGGIIKLEGSDYEQIETPRIEEFAEMTFEVDTLIFDHENPDIVYGKTGEIWALGIIKSEDGMKTWKKMDKDIVASSPTIVLTHPTDPNVVMTSGNVIQESYLTRDLGKTWEPFTPVGAGDDVKVDPHNSNHILLADEMTSIYESYDSGGTFRRIARDFSSAKVFDFEIAKDDPEKVYVSNLGVGISKFLGEGWDYLTNSPDYAYDIEIDPEDSNIFYVTYSPKIFENHSSIWKYSKYQEENLGWSEILRIENSRGFTSIRFDPSDPDRIYAGVTGQRGAIYVSDDKGQTWDILNDKFIMSTVWGQPQLIVDPDNPYIVYAATWLGGTWKTTNAGETWQLLENAPISGTALSINKENTDVVYLADRSSPTVWKTEDGGQNWKQVADFTGDGALLVMRVFAEVNTVYASTFMPALRGGRLYRSTDAGETWKDITGTLPKGILDIEVDRINPGIVYVTTNVNGAFKSTDSGETWSEMQNFPYVGAYDIEVDQDDPRNLYAAARGGSLPGWFAEIAGYPDGITFNDSAGVYRSTDSGQTWSKLLATGVSCRAIRRHPDNPDLLFAPDLMDGLQMSTDGGRTWTKINEGLDNCVPTSVEVNGDRIYVGTQGCGVYSGDIDADKGTVTWQPGRSNKPVPEVHNLQIEIDPTNLDIIFVGSYPGGLFATTNGGVTFGDRNGINPSSVVAYPQIEGYYTFAIDPANPSRMWLGTWGKGIYVSYNGNILNVPRGLFGKHIRKIVIDPSNSSNVYVAAKEGVFVTRDYGKTWEEMNEGLETLDIRSLKITSAEFPPFEDDFKDGDADGWGFKEGGWSVIKEGNNYVLQGVAHKWIDTGSKNWADYTFESKVKLIEGQVHVNYRFSEAGRYAIGLSEGSLSLTRTIFENGVHTQLESLNMRFDKNRWYKIKIIGKGNSIRVYVDDVLKIDYTDDEPLLNGKIAFESHPDSRIRVDDVKVTIDSPGIYLYVGTGGYGIYKFDPISRKWQNLGDTFGSGWWSPWERRMYQFSSILFDPDVPGKVYYGHFPSGFFISEDNGHTWEDSGLGLGNDGMFSLSMHPHNHDILYAGTYNGVSRSVDCGKTWAIKSTGMPSEQWPYTIAIDDENPDIMYASTKNGQNKGLCQRNQDTFCGVVMKSTDGGESWFEIMNGLHPISEFYTLIIYPDNHDILFMSTNRGVYMSRDAGNSWKAINGGLPTKENQVRDNVADNLALTADKKYLVLGLVDHGMWKADISKIDSGPM